MDNDKIQALIEEMLRAQQEFKKIPPEDIQWYVKPEAAEAFAQMIRNGVISPDVILDSEDDE